MRKNKQNTFTIWKKISRTSLAFKNNIFVICKGEDQHLAGILFLISAPSGSGKSTLVNQLRSLVQNLQFSVSWTTRAPRGSEQEAREYHFISREEF